MNQNDISYIYIFFFKGSGKVSANYPEKNVRTGRRYSPYTEQNAYNFTSIRFTISTSGISHTEVTTWAEQRNGLYHHQQHTAFNSPNPFMLPLSLCLA